MLVVFNAQMLISFSKSVAIYGRAWAAKEEHRQILFFLWTKQIHLIFSPISMNPVLNALVVLHFLSLFPTEVLTFSL